jgi:hypothetical protein
MPAPVTFARPSFTLTDSLPPATFNGVTVISGTVPDATPGGFGVIRLAGDFTGEASAPQLVATGANAGSYGAGAGLDIPSLIIDAKGRVTFIANRSLGTSYGKTLLEAANPAAARTNLGLGGAALLNVGTTPNTLAAGDDPRLTDSRRCNNTFDEPATARANLGLGGAALLNVGTTPNTVAAGNDARLADSRKCNNTFDTPATARANLGLNIWATATSSESGALTLPAIDQTLEFAHNLGGLPLLAWVSLRCITAEYGYGPGDEVPVGRTSPEFEQCCHWWNATNVGVRFRANYPVVTRRDAADWAPITAAKWRVIFRAVR